MIGEATTLLAVIEGSNIFMQRVKNKIKHQIAKINDLNSDDKEIMLYNALCVQY